MGEDTTAIKKRRRNPMNGIQRMIETIGGKHRFAKRTQVVKCSLEPTGFFAHPMSMITTVGKHLLGNGDRW